MPGKKLIIDDIGKEFGINSNTLMKKLAYFLEPQNYDYPVFYPPYNNLYTADITPSEDIQRHLKKNHKKTPINFFFALPWCSHRCPYCLYHCNVTLPAKPTQEEYTTSLIKEFDLYLRYLNPNRIDTIYIGGGTPSLLDENCLNGFFNALLAKIKEHKISPNDLKELNFEIHPQNNVDGIIKILKKFFDPSKLRISLGVQSFIDDRINNIRGTKAYTSNDIMLAINNLFAHEKVKTNLDLMWGLNGKSISDELDFIHDNNISPTTFTFYQIQSPGDVARHLNYVGNIEKNIREILKQRKIIFERLNNFGFKPILFPAYFHQNNSKNDGAIYNTKQMDKDSYYIGLGVSGHSKLSGFAYRNTEDIKKYIEMVGADKLPISYIAKLSEKNIEKRNNLLRMRLPEESFSPLDVQTMFADTLKENDIDELVQAFFNSDDSGLYRLNNNGKIFVDEIIRLAIKSKVSALAQYDKRIIHTYLNTSIENDSDRDTTKIKNILSFMKISVGQLLVQEPEMGNFVANIGYTSDILNRHFDTTSSFAIFAIFNKEPIGLISTKCEWEKVRDDFYNIPNDEKLFFFPLLFHSLQNIGIAYPLIVKGDFFLPGNTKQLSSRLSDAIKDVKTYNYLKARETVAEQKGKIESFWAMKKLFNCYVEEIKSTCADDCSKKIYLYFLMSKSAKTSAGGAVVALYSENPANSAILKPLESLSRYLEDIFALISEFEFIKEIAKHALRSAISTIMSRNMSHNLGSHVLINFERREFGSSEQLGSVNTFLQYIRFRMDFIAQIATEWPLWLTPTRFCQDLLYSFFQQQFILEYISASEHLCAEKIRFFIHISEDNNKEVIFEPVNPTNSEKVNEFRKQLLESEKLIPMRGGGTGRHAFYVILENFIRNAAKHSYSGSGNLDIHIRLKDCEENYIVELWDNVSCGEKLIKDIREKSGQKIIDDSGKIRKGSWGIAEIKICSAFLGHKNIMDLVPSQGQNGSPMVVDEEKVENKSYLKYSFAIPKAREVLIISPDGAICPNIKGGIWVEKSFNIFDANDSSFSYEVCVICPPENADGKGKQSLLCEMLDDIGINLERMPSRLLWVGDEKDFAKTLDNYPYITKRVAIISKEDFCQHKNKISLNPEEFKLWLYTKWIIHLRDNVVGDSKCKGKKFYLYLKLTENKSDSLVTPYLSDYLQKNYPYLIAPLVLNPEESSDRDTGWNSLNKIFENKNSALKEVIEKVVVNDTINCDDMPIIAFPRHGYEHDSNLSHLKDRLFYSEYISGASPHFNVIASLPEDRYQMQKLAMLMVEGALPRITVIDERIGKATANCCDELRANSGITCIQKIVFDVGDNGEQQSELGVYGLSEADEWNMSSFTVQFKKDGKVEELNGDEVEKLQTDILFIHQGIIDKLMQRKFWKDKNDMEKWFKMVKKDIPFVVVTSGRGQPDEIPDNVKFIPLSDVLQSFFGRQTTKLLLTYICMHARS